MVSRHRIRDTGLAALITYVMWIVLASLIPVNSQAMVDLKKLKNSSRYYRNRTGFMNQTVIDNNCDRGKRLSKIHQLWLFTNYQGLWQYRKTLHPYTMYQDKEDLSDSPSFDGSVIFLNWQDVIITLDCPCGTKVDKWTMYGKGGNDFNKARSGVKKNPLTIKVPLQRNYYRTFSCNIGGKVHYFNVFTRPLGLTSMPPLMFTEGVVSPASSKPEVNCLMTMYENHQKSMKFTYIPYPFTILWIFPSEYNKLNRVYKSRPSNEGSFDNLYWPKQTGFPDNQPGSNSSIKLTINNEESISELCPNSVYSKNGPDTIALGSTAHVVETPTYSIAGIYTCIIVDANGLSSAFWWDGADPPIDGFRGHTYIRVRPLTTILKVIGIFLGLCILVPICIFILPDNTEDFELELVRELPPSPEPEPSKKVDEKILSKTSVITVHSESRALKPRKSMSIMDEIMTPMPRPKPKNPAGSSSSKIHTKSQPKIILPSQPSKNSQPQIPNTAHPSPHSSKLLPQPQPKSPAHPPPSKAPHPPAKGTTEPPSSKARALSKPAVEGITVPGKPPNKKKK